LVLRLFVGKQLQEHLVRGSAVLFREAFPKKKQVLLVDEFLQSGSFRAIRRIHPFETGDFEGCSAARLFGTNGALSAFADKRSNTSQAICISASFRIIRVMVNIAQEIMFGRRCLPRDRA
jgi:hypothetical protein